MFCRRLHSKRCGLGDLKVLAKEEQSNQPPGRTPGIRAGPFCAILYLAGHKRRRTHAKLNQGGEF